MKERKCRRGWEGLSLGNLFSTLMHRELAGWLVLLPTRVYNAWTIPRHVVSDNLPTLLARLTSTCHIITVWAALHGTKPAAAATYHSCALDHHDQLITITFLFHFDLLPLIIFNVVVKIFFLFLLILPRPSSSFSQSLFVLLIKLEL